MYRKCGVILFFQPFGPLSPVIALHRQHPHRHRRTTTTHLQRYDPTTVRMVDTQDHSGAGGTTSTPSDSTSFCFPKKNKTHNKRLRPDDLNHDDRSLTVTTSTTTITGITDITPNTTITTAPAASANEAPPPTKKLFSIFHFASNKGRSASSSSFVSSKRQPASHHTTTSTITATSINNNNSCEGRVRNIFVDLDGVLVDFDAGVRQLEQIHAQSKNPHKSLKFNMWAAISRRQHFYRTLPWTEDGKELWIFLVSLLQQQQQHSQTPPVQLHILTGVPWNSNSASVDKFHWCQRELSFDITPTDANAAAAATPPVVLEASTIRTDTGSSLPSTTNAAPSTTPLDSPRPVQQWHWNDMAAPKKAHARVNIAVPTRTGQQKFKGATSTTNTTTTQPEAAVAGATEDGNGNDQYRPKVITCWSVNKFLECRGPGDVLIDDRPTNHDLQQKWERAGGVFLHHTSTRTTIQQLKVIFGVS